MDPSSLKWPADLCDIAGVVQEYVIAWHTIRWSSTLICAYILIHVHACIYIYTHIHNICRYIFLTWARPRAHVRKTYLRIRMYMYMHACVCTNKSMYACVRTYNTYKFVYTHVLYNACRTNQTAYKYSVRFRFGTNLLSIR